MKPELQNKLFNSYPQLFAEKDLPMSKTCMCWGIDCGDGWYNIINALCENIMAYCNSHNCPTPAVIQVKEKFGGLRFYTRGTVWEIDRMIEDAEELSYKTCESCGASGKQDENQVGWIVTLCDECCKEQEKENSHVKGYN